jgi:hypothetical protein
MHIGPGPGRANRRAAPGDRTPPCDVDSGEPLEAAQVAPPARARREPDDDEVDTVEDEETSDSDRGGGGDRWLGISDVGRVRARQWRPRSSSSTLEAHGRLDLAGHPVWLGSR